MSYIQAESKNDIAASLDCWLVIVSFCQGFFWLWTQDLVTPYSSFCQQKTVILIGFFLSESGFGARNIVQKYLNGLRKVPIPRTIFQEKCSMVITFLI